MSSSAKIIITPDAATGIAPVTMTYTFNDPTDILVLISVYQNLYAEKWKNADGSHYVPTPAQVLQAVAEHTFKSIESTVVSEARAAKQSAVTFTFAGATIA